MENISARVVRDLGEFQKRYGAEQGMDMYFRCLEAGLSRQGQDTRLLEELRHREMDHYDPELVVEVLLLGYGSALERALHGRNGTSSVEARTEPRTPEEKVQQRFNQFLLASAHYISEDRSPRP